MAAICYAQSGVATPAPSASNPKAAAYYNFAMGRLYSELAGAYGNRSDYLNKAIEHYRQALRLDPGAGEVFEELADLYVQSGRLRDAITEAEDLLRQHPENLEARRMLGRIYTRLIGDTQQGKVAEGMLKNAVEQYQKITEADAKDAESWVILGRLYRIQRDSVAAEKAYNAALEADPENEDALTGLALLYSDLGDTQKAIEKLRAATDKNPNEHLLAALAGAYEQTRDFDKAAVALQRALQLAPDNGRLKRGLALDLLFAGKLDEALKAYQELAAEEPQEPAHRVRIAEIYRQKHNFEAARSSLKEAKRLDPESVDVRYDEVNLLEAEGNTREAITALKALVADTARKSYSASDSSNRVMFLERLGILYRNGNEYTKAIDAFREASKLESDNGPRLAVQIIDTYRIAKDFTQAQQEATAAVKTYPTDRMVKMAAASLLADLGKVDEAAAQLRTLLKGERDRETYLALAQIYEKAKRFDEMGKSLDEAEKLSTSQDDKEGVIFMRGAMLEKMRRFESAEAEFRKVIAMNPDNSSALNYLGYMFADRNVKLEEAYQLVKRALDLEPQNGAYLDSLGWVYFRQGKLKDAEGLFVQALQKIGQDPTVHDHLGDVYFNLGRTNEAISQWQASLQEFKNGTQSDSDPSEIARINKKLESAKVKLAKETGSNQ
jgi:tetratricopeptide (TPR) repeat protein